MAESVRAVMIFLIEFLTEAIMFNVSFGSSSSYILCIESEKQALIVFKQDFVDPSNRLFFWGATTDCCQWQGILCDNCTGNVKELHHANNADLCLV